MQIFLLRDIIHQISYNIRFNSSNRDIPNYNFSHSLNADPVELQFENSICDMPRGNNDHYPETIWSITPSSHRHFFTFDLPQSVLPFTSTVKTPTKTSQPIQPRHTPPPLDLKVRFLKTAIKNSQNYPSWSQSSKHSPEI